MILKIMKLYHKLEVTWFPKLFYYLETKRVPFQVCKEFKLFFMYYVCLEHLSAFFFFFSLDPDVDPLCIILMIDFYALRSEQYLYLIRMYSEWESHRNLSQLPNFAFSVPLAMFHHANAEGADLQQADEKVVTCFDTKLGREVFTNTVLFVQLIHEHTPSLTFVVRLCRLSKPLSFYPIESIKV